MSKPNTLELEMKNKSISENKAPDFIKSKIAKGKDGNNKSSLGKFEIPISLKKTFVCTITLFLLGITLIIIGSIQQVRESSLGVGITLWCLGGIVIVPGGYYAYQFYKAKKAQSEEDRDDILNEIPQL